MPGLAKLNGQTYEVEACILDKDGTLLGFDHWLEVMRMRGEYLGRALLLSRDQLDALLRFVGIDRKDRAASAEDITTLPRSEAEEAVAGHLHRVTHIPLERAKDAVESAFVEVDKLFPFHRYLRPTPGASDFLQQARRAHLKVALVTHDARSAAERHLWALGWADLVQVIVGIEDMLTLKPSPDGIFEACRRLDVDPEHSLMVGDTPADVGAGRAAGCRPVVGLLTGLGSAVDLAHADHVVADLTAFSFSAISG